MGGETGGVIDGVTSGSTGSYTGSDTKVTSGEASQQSIMVLPKGQSEVVVKENNVEVMQAFKVSLEVNSFKPKQI